jgi:tripartite-type tricarboxylate transporter receptor subunit TctC
MFWLGVFMPAKTPRDIIDKFHDAGIKLLAEPSMQESLMKLGVEPFPMTPAEMDAFVAREIEENLVLIKAAGIKP